MTRQAFGILPKIREVDELLIGDPELQNVVCEIHPEVCFAGWNGGSAMVHSKRKSAGRSERQVLIESHWPAVRDQLVRQLTGENYAPDDLNDALAALWTAARIRAGNAVTIPVAPRFDRMGLRMAMWC